MHCLGIPFREEGDEGKLDFHFYFPSTAVSVQKQVIAQYKVFFLNVKVIQR